MGNRSEAKPTGPLGSSSGSARRRGGVVRYVRITALVVIAGSYAAWVSSTTPFTESADVAVCVGFALMAIAAAASFLHHDRRRTSGGRESIVEHFGCHHQ